MESADPYEQYLLSVFEDCHDYSQGTIAAAGLLQLCEKLHLQDYISKLNELLLGDFSSKRIPFNEFRNGLLQLLGGMDQDQKTDEDLSSESEISPKNALNGEPRKSLRSEQIEKEAALSDDSGDLLQKSVSNSTTTDDDVSDETAPKKRRTRSNKKIERRGSVGSTDFCTKKKNDSDIQTSPITIVNPSNEVEVLINAWSSISKGTTDDLNRDEVVKVFQCVGLEKDSEEAVQCVFEKLGVGQNGKITLEELLNFIKSGDNWGKDSKNQQAMEIVPQQNNINMDYIESSRVGCVTGASIVEQWECAGVPGALQLLQNLGYTPSQNIDLASFVSLLTEEIKCLNDEVKSTRHSMDPLIALLQANSVLQVLYIQSLKTTIEHINAEKEKLRNDVLDANQRATLLAQEVDDHHSKLELSSQQQVKSMEQKHAEKIRDIANRAKIEQDTLLAQNVALEQKIKVLEDEEAKNKALILQLQLENNFMEQEHRSIVDQLTAVESTKTKMEKDLQNVAMLQQKLGEMEAKMNENDIGSLLERIQTLEADNTSLRDRNDELSVEIEDLSTKLSNSCFKKKANFSNSSSANNSVEENSGGFAVKRRVDAFGLMDAAEDVEGEEGSPRLGKVRKCSHAKDHVDSTLSLSELDICEKNHENTSKDIISNEKLGFPQLQDVFTYKDSSLHHIIPFSEELQQIDGNKLKTSDLTKKILNEDANARLQKIKEKLKKFEGSVDKEILSTIEELLQEKSGNSTAEEESLKNRCKDLENSLELLKIEYEKTEDYWSEKLEEERTFFEEEQKISDKKYSELLDKILEYEALLNSEREQRQRLETIEEKDSFERQVADMEQECSELKNKLAETVREKEVEMEKLKNEIISLKHSRDCTDSGVQVCTIKSSDKDEQSLRENENIDPKKLISKKSGKLSGCRQCSNVKLMYQREIQSIREERERLLEEISHQKLKLSSYNNMVLNGTGKYHVLQLEEKCQSLMVTLRQQQKQTEDILKNTWKQHKTEVRDLKSVLKMTEEKLKRQTKVIQEQLSKLARTDLLVKDLFVENAYLISSVQKLEEQCQSVSHGTTTVKP